MKELEAIAYRNAVTIIKTNKNQQEKTNAD